MRTAARLGGQPLEAAHHLEQILRPFGGKDADARAAPGQQVDEPFIGEKLQRLPQGGARHIERFRQIHLVQAFARHDLTFDDQVA